LLLLGGIASSHSSLLLYMSSVVDWSVGHVREPCRNGWTDRDAVWDCSL